MRPTEYDIRMIRQSIEKLERQMQEKTNICATQDLMNRVNYLETTNNDLTNRVRRLEDEIQRLDNEARTFQAGIATMQEYMQRVGNVFEHDRPYEQKGSD